MKITDYIGEDAIDLLADIVEPVATILSDEKIVKDMQNGKTLKAVQTALKTYKKEIVEVMARLEGVPVKEYKGNIITMTKTLLDILNDKELASFFTTAESETSVIPFGNATEDTEVKEN